MMLWLNNQHSIVFRILALIFGILSNGSVSLGRPLKVYAPDWPPFYIQDGGSGQNKGMAWDILATCTRSIDPSTIFDNYPIRRMMKLMEEGEIDVNIMSYKPDREKMLSYGKEVIFENNYVIIVGNHVTKPIRKLNDLDTLSVAQLVGLRPSDTFKAWFDRRLANKAGKETLQLNSEEQILKMLANGRIDATVASEAEFKWRSQRLGLTHRIRHTKLLIQKQPYFFVMAKQSPIFRTKPVTLQRMDQCVRDLKKSGIWTEMKNRYQL
jgi:ABC-type amino acid transport substrate-binding protein